MPPGSVWKSTSELRQTMDNVASMTMGRLKFYFRTGLASEAGVDVEGFRRVLDTPAAQQDVRRACAQASQRGVRGVPYFVVSGREDARPIGFSGAIDAPQLVEIFGEVL